MIPLAHGTNARSTHRSSLFGAPLLVLLLATLSAATGCRPRSPAPDGGTAEGGLPAPAASTGAAPSPAGAAAGSPSSGAAPSTFRIAPERQQTIGVRFAVAGTRPASVAIRAVGRIAFDETRIAHVHVKVMGWIEDVDADFIGETVHKGERLFTFYSPELVAAQEEYLLALRGRSELGGSSFARVAEGSRALADAARRRLEAWDMTPEEIAAIEAQGSASRTVTIVSPVNGVVTERAAYHHGRTVTPDMDLYTIVDLSRIWVQAQVYEADLPHVRVGQAAEAVLPYDPGRKPLRGRVAFVAPVLDPKTRTGEVRIEFANPDLSLRPDAFVDVILRRDLGERLVIPKDAVMDSGTSQYVFVDRGDGYLEPRAVKAGPEVAAATAGAVAAMVVSDGLSEGERVVTAANFIVDSESRLAGAFAAMGSPARPAAAGGGPDGAGAGPAGAEGAGATQAAGPAVRIAVTTDPSPARVGRNRIRVTVTDPGGRPVDDAQVDVRLFMPAMVNMAQVDRRETLRRVGAGEYACEIEIPMAWTYSTTVTVRRAGATIGTAETGLTAR